MKETTFSKSGDFKPARDIGVRTAAMVTSVAGLILCLWVQTANGQHEIGINGTDSGEAYIEQVAEIVQTGQDNRANVTQSGRAPAGLIPDENIVSLLLSGDTGNFRTTAEIIQHGEVNRADILQWGLSNMAKLIQHGSNQEGDIVQFGHQNRGDIFQEGVGNQAYMFITGHRNDIRVHQSGAKNLFDLDLEGSDNHLNLLQEGNHNIYERLMAGDAVLNEDVIQLGNQNSFIQTGSLSGGRSVNILQEGDGLELIIRHEQ